jgi:hypothetical protein
MAHSSLVHAAVQDVVSPTAPVLGAREAWGLVAPWLGHVFLTAAAVLGLFTASGGAEGATYGSGLATFFVAVFLIFVRIKRQLDGQEIGFLLPFASGNVDTLMVTIAVLFVLGLVGAVLAATVGGTLYGIGLALFIITVAIIFSSIKRYFDLRETGG